jgi:NTP pyrophosphatase (non-canonical NTP hydrolase)
MIGMRTKWGDYQSESKKTALRVQTSHPVVYPTLGLLNEAGELAGKVKKILRDKDGRIDDHEVDRLKGELGDVLWYFTQICTELGLTLEEVAEANLEKIFDRKKRGVIKGEGDER